MKPTDYLSVAEAATELGLRTKTLRRRINRGTVKVDTLVGKQVLTRDQVQKMKEQG